MLEVRNLKRPGNHNNSGNSHVTVTDPEPCNNSTTSTNLNHGHVNGEQAELVAADELSDSEGVAGSANQLIRSKAIEVRTHFDDRAVCKHAVSAVTRVL